MITRKGSHSLLAKVATLLLLGGFAGALAMAGYMNFTPESAPGSESVDWTEFTADQEPSTPEVTVDAVLVDPTANLSVADTATFVFGLAPATHGALGGSQTFGSMNKVGVHTSVDTAFPNIGAELAYIGSDNAAREAMLASEGVSLTDPNRRWLVKVWEVATVGADQRYVVSAGVGKDPDTASQASSSNGTMGTLHELWLKHPDGSNPTLIRRSTQWASPDTQ